MALVVGTNCGFVLTAPSSDPQGPATSQLDSWSYVNRFTSPADMDEVKEMGMYISTNAGGTPDWNLGIYSHDAANGGKPNVLLGSAGDAALPAGVAWHIRTGLSISLSPSTIYWMGYQCDDDTEGNSNFDRDSAQDTYQRQAKSGIAELSNPWGTSDFTYDGVMSCYSLYTQTSAARAELTGHYVGDMTVLGVLSNCWQKIGEGDLGAPASSFTLAGLSGDTDVLYNLILRNIDASTIGDHKLTFNTDTGANYGMQELVGSTTTASALRTTGGSFIKVGETKTDDYTSFSDTFIYAPANKVRTLLTTLASDITGATVGEIAFIGGVWQDTTTSISQIVVTATADNFEANTHYELWRLNL